jgi:transcription antitermination factor NusG
MAASPAPTPAPEQDAQWYVVHAYSGHEEKVKKNLEKRIESMDMQDKILQVLVPMEDDHGGVHRRK